MKQYRQLRYSSWKNRATRTRSRRKGVTIVLVSFAMIVLLGFCAFAVDYGMMVSDANRMQRAADAAALAGATQLMVSGIDPLSIQNDQTQAKYLAAMAGWRNGVTINQNDITFPTSNTIVVPATNTRAFFFGRALGLQQGTVTRQARAGKQALNGIDNAVPLAITTTDYALHKDGSPFEFPLIDNNKYDFNPGTIDALDLRTDLSGKSGAVFQNDLTYGYNGTVYIGEKIDNTLNANLSSENNKLDTAMNQRITDAANASYADTGNNYTFPNYPAGDERVFSMIVADPNPLSNNNPTLNARFFVPVYIVKTRTSSGNEYLKLRILPSYTFSSTDPNVQIGDSTTAWTGENVITLMQ